MSNYKFVSPITGTRYASSVKEAKEICDREVHKECITSGERLSSTITGKEKIQLKCNDKTWIIYVKA